MTPSTRENELQLGIADLVSRLSHKKLELLEHRRPWPDRLATYFVIGLSGKQKDRQLDIVIPDDFLRDLPGTRAYQDAVDAFLSSVANRLSCGSAQQFYCQSGRPVRMEIHWPIFSAVQNSVLRTWLRVDVSDLRDGASAICAVNPRLPLFPGDETIFDTVKTVINGIRRGVDKGEVAFVTAGTSPQTYSYIERDPSKLAAATQAEMEQFLVGKVYWLAFRVVDAPGKIWIADPWDAEYLGVAVKELRQCAYVLQAKGLLELDSTQSFAGPTEKLVIEGLPAVLDGTKSAPESQKFTLSALPNKDQLLSDLQKALSQSRDSALVVIDLDNFKEVNDTMGHPEGDACLERVVDIFGQVLRGKGTLYRWGGDEFAVLLPNFCAIEAYATAERMRCAIETAKPGDAVIVTTSIGVCGTDRLSQCDAKEMLSAADKAMYASKRAGKNRVSSWPLQES